MKLVYPEVTYISESFDDPESGNAGVSLLALSQSKSTCVAKITFWDATGQFVFEMTESELPLDVIEALIAEAKQQIPIE